MRTLKDSDSSIRAYENRAVTGDNFLNNLYERPFTSQEMVYQPDLDIITVDFGDGENFFYFTIRLYGMNPDEWGLNGVYGVEFDRTLTGRGDLVVSCRMHQKIGQLRMCRLLPTATPMWADSSQWQQRLKAPGMGMTPNWS